MHRRTVGVLFGFSFSSVPLVCSFAFQFTTLFSVCQFGYGGKQRGKAFTTKIAAALLKNGKAKVKGLRSLRTGNPYDGTIVLADTGGKYVNYRIEK